MASTASAGPVDRSRQSAMIAVSVIFTFFGLAALILRLIGRFVITRRLGPDDWFMVAGMIFTLGYLIEILYGLKWNIGLHGSEDSLNDAVHLLQIVYSIQLTYNTVIYLVKTSIVVFYLRLATVDSSLRKSSLAVAAFLTLFYISSQTTTTLQCLPVQSNWDLVGKYTKKCINTEVYFYVLAVLNIIVDIVILALPINTLKDMKRGTRDKVVLFILFGVGGFSSISSIIRLYTIKVFTDSKDPFWDGVPINIWSMIEINVAVICASVPAMKPLFTKSIRDRAVTQRTQRSYNHQMMPLSGEERSGSALRSGRFRDRKEPTYSAHATGGTMGGSEEHIVGKLGGIEYEREFTVEESYIGSSKVLPQAKLSSSEKSMRS
ncbi:uncharacterized protein LY89DRAFT_736511 [Mollisia scopiformis]|uniref:Rhodopsin domain-containing protein n=1 Tax=Mollisia scopiformis TaxID=149040 RepID=A0A194X2S5_MOLSC|nr:uncharacterized protein LY89DRAFT_736511 [Mollisia scopiformis]KUJ14478.1 hypothetical protein LY89DRAFT_736511 [Mollisia scopiformis]